MWLLMMVMAVCCGATAAMQCTEARLRCAYRKGCGAALNNYEVVCYDVMNEPTSRCPEPCEHALIALTSTEEGKELMNCQCEEDAFCVETKRRMEVCRPQVLSASANITSSCRLSQLICLADAECATALEYYYRLCRSMYQGRKCSHKCLNSIDILKKQEKAKALTECHCDGQEDYDCPRMQSNLAKLCYHKHRKNHRKNKEQGREKPARRPTKRPGPAEPPPEVKTDAATSATPHAVLFALSFYLLNT